MGALRLDRQGGFCKSLPTHGIIDHMTVFRKGWRDLRLNLSGLLRKKVIVGGAFALVLGVMSVTSAHVVNEENRAPHHLPESAPAEAQPPLAKHSEYRTTEFPSGLPQERSPLFMPDSWVRNTLDAGDDLRTIQRIMRDLDASRTEEKDVQDKPSPPKALLEAYFAALADANHLTAGQSEAAGGTLGMGREPYPVAYDYWTSEWKGKHTYEQFLDSWSGTAHVQLLKLYEAETKNGDARFFVETKHLEAVGENPKFGEFYYSGFFSVQQTDGGWKIAEGRLEPQNLAWALGGHQPWLADPVQVAVVHGLGKRMDDERNRKSEISYRTDDFVIVRVFDDQDNIEAEIQLVRPEEGIWKVIAVEKQVVFSYYEGPGEDIREIKYSDEQKNFLRDAGRKYGIEPVIPLQGVATDYLMEVRLKKNVLEMVYPHFAVRQSNHDFIQQHQEEAAETVESRDGYKMHWLPERRILYVNMNDVHITVSSAKSAGKEEFVQVARSFLSLGR